MIHREGLYHLKGNVQTDEISIGSQTYQDRLKRREDRHTRFLMGVQEGKTRNKGKDYPQFVSFEQLAAAFKEDILPAIEKRIAKGSTLKTDDAGAFKEAKEKGYTKLFEGVGFKFNPVKYSSQMTVRFADYLKKIGIKSGANIKHKSFHSLRKTITTALHELNVSDVYAFQITGHKAQSLNNTHYDAYVSSFQMNSLKQELEKLKFEIFTDPKPLT